MDGRIDYIEIRHNLRYEGVEKKNKNILVTVFLSFYYYYTLINLNYLQPS